MGGLGWLISQDNVTTLTWFLGGVRFGFSEMLELRGIRLL